MVEQGGGGSIINITSEVVQRSSLEVTEEEVRRRGEPRIRFRQDLAKGFLGKIYPFLVGPVERGAVLEVPSSYRNSPTKPKMIK
jgi:hypothetical protein